MTVANRELCKELLGLSEWDSTDFYHNIDNTGDVVAPAHQSLSRIGKPLKNRFPAYDLGYLLRKLPRRFTDDDTEYTLRMPSPFDTDWRFDYWNETSKSRPFDKGDGNNLIVVADTPEDAACSLAIELFKAGVLSKEEQRG